jgi:hypothetical protein
VGEKVEGKIQLIVVGLARSLVVSEMSSVLMLSCSSGVVGKLKTCSTDVCMADSS